MGASPRPDGICHQHKHMVLLDIGHSWAFLRKLAPKYPARQKEILAQRKLYVIPDKWCGQKREKKILESHNPLVAFVDGGGAYATIKKEWRAANKRIGIFAILMFNLLAMELLLWDRSGWIRPMLQDHLSQSAYKSRRSGWDRPARRRNRVAASTKFRIQGRHNRCFGMVNPT